VSCVLCLVFKISHPISHISYLISQIYLLPLYFVSRSDLLRTLFGAASENTRTRSEQGPNERGLRVERGRNESGRRVEKKVRDMGCEMWDMRCEIWDVRYEMWEMRCEIWDRKALAKPWVGVSTCHWTVNCLFSFIYFTKLVSLSCDKEWTSISPKIAPF
jgi:hypothetical protein